LAQVVQLDGAHAEHKMSLHPKKILVASDFSPYAQAAADAAGVMARAFVGDLTLLHVVPLSVYVDLAQLDSGSAPAPDLLAAARLKVQKSADAELARLKAEGVIASFVTVDGPAPAEIARVAREGHFDLVVVGTHGRTGLRHLALGSVAENVVRLAPCAVLVVRLEGSAP
jgi:nucleotide-binding universal stress UspA family protein